MNTDAVLQQSKRFMPFAQTENHRKRARRIQIEKTGATNSDRAGSVKLNPD